MSETTKMTETCNRSALIIFYFLKQRRTIFAILFFTALCIIAYWPSFFTWNEHNNQIMDLREEKVLPVLFWTKFFGSDKFARSNVETMFKNCPAPANRCRLTINRSLIEESAAVIFHMWDYSVANLPKFRSPNQRWVFFNMEPPHYTLKHMMLKNLPPKYFFNWTQTYRRDSDFVTPYGLTVEGIRKTLKSRKIGLDAILSNKTKGVAWIVSNCKSKSGREKYVTELKKYIPVDVYGKCSNLTCPNKNCYEALGRQYKFYLSFENSLCRDYITEKFYLPLLYSMVPVVYGGGDYEASPNSFIDVRNFQTAKQLAEYLHFLDGNDAAYRRYFDWRFKENDGYVFPQRPTACAFCEKLVSNDTAKFYPDIYSWWYDGGHCQKEISPN